MLYSLCVHFAFLGQELHKAIKIINAAHWKLYATSKRVVVIKEGVMVVLSSPNSKFIINMCMFKFLSFLYQLLSDDLRKHKRGCRQWKFSFVI